MASCFDVAKYILEKRGELTTMKLQKLVYYSQAWSLVWDDSALFEEEIEAWCNGPVIPTLYQSHKGKYQLLANDIQKGNANNLTDNQKDTIDHILDYYGKESSQWLSDLTHIEAPWKEARRGLPPNERGNKIISKESMLEYYSSLPPEEN